MRNKYIPDSAPIILIKSEEPVYADRVYENFRKKLRETNANIEISRIESGEYQSGELAVFTSPSLFGEPRAIYIPDLESANRQLADELMKYIPNPEPDVTLILRHNGSQRGKNLLSLLKKAKVPTVEIPKVKTAADKVRAVQEDVARRKRVIAPRAATALVDALGSDLRELLAVTNQLLDDIPGKITQSDVELYFAGRIEAGGYHVADALVIGDVAKAIKMSRHAIAAGVSGPAIVAALAFKFRTLALVSGMHSTRTGYKVTLASWQADRAKRELRGWSAVGLGRAIQEIAQADADVKGGSRDISYALERTILAIGRARKMK